MCKHAVCRITIIKLDLNGTIEHMLCSLIKCMPKPISKLVVFELFYNCHFTIELTWKRGREGFHFCLVIGLILGTFQSISKHWGHVCQKLWREHGFKMVFHVPPVILGFPVLTRTHRCFFISQSQKGNSKENCTFTKKQKAYWKHAHAII